MERRWVTFVKMLMADAIPKSPPPMTDTLFTVLSCCLTEPEEDNGWDESGMNPPPPLTRPCPRCLCVRGSTVVDLQIRDKRQKFMRVFVFHRSFWRQRRFLLKLGSHLIQKSNHGGLWLEQSNKIKVMSIGRTNYLVEDFFYKPYIVPVV